jgi:transcriptional regulator with XRE-family HTH domain
MSLQAISFDDILHAMGRHSKKRHAASEAVIALREALGQTQQAFAHKMKTAIVTIARWETSQPPHGQALLRLAEVAKQAWLKDKAGPDVESPFDGLQFKFVGLYIDEVLADVSGSVSPGERYNQIFKWNPKTSTGFVVAKVQGSAQKIAAVNFIADLKEAK